MRAENVAGTARKLRAIPEREGQFLKSPGLDNETLERLKKGEEELKQGKYVDATLKQVGARLR